VLLNLGKVAYLIVVIVPLAAFWATLFRRRTPRLPACEAILFACVAVAATLLAEIGVTTLIPIARPLDWLPVTHWIVAGGSVAWLIARRGSFGELLGATLRGIWAVLRESGLGVRLFLLITASAAAAAAVHGLWNACTSWDELSYHMPQALQAYQDGFVGAVKSNVEWADSYPRAVALLYFWTMALVRSDAAVHCVSSAFGLVFALAAYVAARRMQFDRELSALCGGIGYTAPIVLYLCSIGYIDLVVGGVCATMIAMALPEREGGWGVASAVTTLLAVVLAWWMKFIPIVIIAMTLGFIALRLWVERRRFGPAGRVHPIVFCGAAIVALAIGSAPYVRAYVKYGAPTYPVKLSLAGVVLFDGPLDPAGFGRMNDRPVLERYSTFWTNFREPQTTDSAGGLGLVFALAIVFPAMACLFALPYRFNLCWAYLLAIFWHTVALPEMHIPRYTIFILVPGAMCLARALQGGKESGFRSGGTLALAALAAYGIAVYADPVIRHIRWQFAVGDMTTPARNRLIVEDYALDYAGLRGPARREIYKLMKPGETLVFALNDFHTLMHDPDYTYRVEFRTAHDRNARQIQQPCDAGVDAAYVESLKRDGVRVAVVYAGGCEDVSLAAPGSGYHVVLRQDTPEGHPEIVVYGKDGPN
jgi:hypothetical protein